VSDKQWLDNVGWNDRGLVAAIAQDHQSGQVLMMAWMNREALELTVETRTAVYWSRSRTRLWRKGETSGHTQKVLDIRIDCDADVVLLQVEQNGLACHTGRQSCFYQSLQDGVWEEIAPVLKDPGEIYPGKG